MLLFNIISFVFNVSTRTGNQSWIGSYKKKNLFCRLSRHSCTVSWTFRDQIMTGRSYYDSLQNHQKPAKKRPAISNHFFHVISWFFFIQFFLYKFFYTLTDFSLTQIYWLNRYYIIVDWHMIFYFSFLICRYSTLFSQILFDVISYIKFLLIRIMI